MLAELTLNGGDFVAIGGMVGTIIAVPVVLLLFILKQHTARMETVEKRVDKITEAKVAKEEWIRESMTTRKKVDRISEQLSSISGEIRANLGLPAAVDKLAKRIGDALRSNADGCRGNAG